MGDFVGGGVVSSLGSLGDGDGVTIRIFRLITIPEKFHYSLLLFIFPKIFPKFDFCFLASSDKSFPWQIKSLTFIRSFSRKLIRNYTF